MKFSQRYEFSDWPNPEVPEVAAGVYVIWEDDLLLYCGMSGRDIEGAIEERKERYGLVTRLHSHASGRLSGDQFCVYVANRLVIPSLESGDLRKFAEGSLTLDQVTRKYIHDRLSYQYSIVKTSSEAYSSEIAMRRGYVIGEKPLLNPLD